MRARLLVLPLLVLAVGGGLALLQHREAPAPDREEASGDPHPAAKDPGPEGEWFAQPVRVETLPRWESLPARVIAPDPVLLFTDLHAPFVEVAAEEGQTVRKGDLLARAGTDSIERALAAAEKAGDGGEVARLKEALGKAELRSPADGILHRLEARLGEMPPAPNSRGPRPVAILFDWTKITFEGTIPAALADLAKPGAAMLVRIGDDFGVPGEFLSVGEPAADGTLPVAVRPLAPPGRTPEPGAPGEILLVTGSSEGLVVPAASLGIEGGRTVVWEVTITEELVPRPVGVGASVRKGWVEITGVDRGISVAVFGPRPGPR